MMRNCALVFLLVLGLAGSARADSYADLRRLISKALEGLEKLDKLIEQKSNSSSVIGRITGKGYEYFSQSATINKVTNLNRGFFNQFVDMMVPRFGVPPADQKEIKEKVFGKLRDDTEPGQWVEHKMLFNPIDDPEHTKYICIYGFVRETGNFDLVVLEMKAAFTLAKNMLIIHNKITGKISLEEEELETERLPGDVDKDDVQVLLKFFEATALRVLSSRV